MSNKVILIKIGLPLILLAFIGAYYYIFQIVSYEVKNNQEYGGRGATAGNCRFVNAKIAFNKGYSLYFLDRIGIDWKRRHVIAVDERTKKVYDVSEGNNLIEGECLSQYLKRNQFYSYGKLSIEDSSYTDSYNDFNILNYAGLRIYYYFFKQV